MWLPYSLIASILYLLDFSSNFHPKIGSYVYLNVIFNHSILYIWPKLHNVLIIVKIPCRLLQINWSLFSGSISGRVSLFFLVIYCTRNWSLLFAEKRLEMRVCCRSMNFPEGGNDCRQVAHISCVLSRPLSQKWPLYYLPP